MSGRMAAKFAKLMSRSTPALLRWKIRFGRSILCGGFEYELIERFVGKLLRYNGQFVVEGHVCCGFLLTVRERSD